MNPQSSDQVINDTNNLVANVAFKGYVVFSSSDFTDTGATLGDSPAREAYYATKSVTLGNIKSTLIPFITVWKKYGLPALTDVYYQVNSNFDYYNPAEKWERSWYTLDKVTSNGVDVLRLNMYTVEQITETTYPITFYYGVTTACFTESSGL